MESSNEVIMFGLSSKIIMGMYNDVIFVMSNEASNKHGLVQKDHYGLD